MPEKTYTQMLTDVVPLTPSGLAAFKHKGRPAQVADLVTEVDKLTADDLARLTALASFVAAETKNAKKGA